MYGWIIIDANNLIHSDRSEVLGLPSREGTADFNLVRWRLARVLDELAGALAERVTLVFDGTAGGADEVFRSSSVLEVLFAPPEATADSLIESLVAEVRDPTRVLVVSSDRGERFTVGAAGAMTMSCENFLGLVQDCQGSLTRQLKRTSMTGLKPRLGDFFP